MTKIICLIASLAVFFGGLPAANAQSLPLAYEASEAREAQRELARDIAASLEETPDGTGLIAGTPCLTPRLLLEDLRRAGAPGLPEHVDGLADYIRVLIPRLARNEGLTESYRMSALSCSTPDSVSDDDRITYVSREFRTEELAFFHPNFDQAILAGDCRNVIHDGAPQRPGPPEQRAIQDQCVYVQLDTRPAGPRTGPDTAIQFALLGEGGPSECLGYQAFDELPETMPTDGWEMLPTRCPEGPCSFTRVLSYTGMPMLQSGGWAVDPGQTYVVRLPRDYAMSPNGLPVFCLSFQFSTGRTGHSCGMDVQPNDFVDGWARIHHLGRAPVGLEEHRLFWAYGACTAE